MYSNAFGTAGVKNGFKRIPVMGDRDQQVGIDIINIFTYTFVEIIRIYHFAG